MRRFTKLIPIFIAMALLFVSCATKTAPEYPNIRPMMEKLFDAKPQNELDEIIDPMKYYWDIAINSKILADASYAWKEFSIAEEAFIGIVAEMWPVDISESSGVVLALVPTDPELLEESAPIAYMYKNYANHVQMYVDWKAYAEALGEYIQSLAALS